MSKKCCLTTELVLMAGRMDVCMYGLIDGWIGVGMYARVDGGKSYFKGLLSAIQKIAQLNHNIIEIRRKPEKYTIKTN